MKLAIILVLLSGIFFSCENVKDRKGESQAPMRLTSAEKVTSEGFSSEKLAILDSFLTAKIADETIPHMVTFIARNGKIVHHKSFGKMSPDQEMTNDAIFRIASQSKAIISVGLMKLFEKGHFLLDDPVAKYIPAFRDPEILLEYDPDDSTYTTKKAESGITIQHLLTHTAGIPYGLPVYVNAGIPMLNSLENITLDEIIPRLGELPIVHEPGEKFTYGLNTDILGYLIEVLSGKKLDVYLQNEIFEPLGMKDSYFYLPEEKQERLVSLYQKATADSPLQPSENKNNATYPVAGAKSYFSGGAGLVGTIKDYAKFCQMLLNGGEFNHQRILSPHTIKMMIANQIGDLEVWNRSNKFGLGFEIVTNEHLKYLPGSEGAYRWGGAYATDYYIDPAENLIYLFYTNIRPFYYYDELFKRCRIITYAALID